mgnify:CR=1 FL=1
MSKKRISKKIISCFMLCALVMSSAIGLAINSNAASKNDVDNVCIYFVNNEKWLKSAVERAVDGDSIIFTNDVIYNGDLKVTKDINFDFANHSLKFIKSVNGLVLEGNNKINLKSGDIYASKDSNSAVSIRSGDVSFEHMKVYGGDCSGYGTDEKGGHYVKYYGNAVYCKSDKISVFVDGCYFQGGNGYSKGVFKPSRTGKAIYGVNILYVGTDGYKAVNGEYR